MPACIIESIFNGPAHAVDVLSLSFEGWVASQSVPLCPSQVLYVGGNSNTNASNSVNYGLSYANANNDLSNSNNNIGARLYFDIDNAGDATLLFMSRTQESRIAGPVATEANARSNIKGEYTLRTLKNVYESVIDMNNLRKAADDACGPRRGRKEVVIFRQNEEELLRKLRDDLRLHRYRPSPYHIYTKQERGKERLIADLPIYPDRIVHCAIARQIEDILNRRLIHQTHASIKGHGTHTVMTDMRRQLHNDPKIRYVLSMDVHGFYASIPPMNAKLMLRHYIRDPELLYLMDIIIDSYNATGNPGIALGGRLSPLIANLYLNALDHRLKQDLHVHYYQRYMDNMFVMGYSKEWLHQIHRAVCADLAELGLRLNDNWSIQPIDSTHGVDVVGWIVYSDHIRIRKKTKVKMVRTFARARRKLESGKELDAHELGAVNSYAGSLRWFDSYNLC